MYLRKLFPFRLITFDVTNTLLDFQGSIGKIYGDIGLKYGVKCDRNELTKYFRHEFKKMSVEYPNFGKDSELSWQNWWNIVVCETFKKCQSDVSESKLESICSDLIDLYSTSNCWITASGSVELLNYLKDRGVSLGVISNYDPRLHDVLKDIGLDKYFNFILTSHEIGFSKPDKRIFEEAMAVSNLPNLKNSHCLHIGDNVEFDYKGAKNVGWHSFLVSRQNEPTEKFPSNSENQVRFSDLGRLQEYFEKKWNMYEVQ